MPLKQLTKVLLVPLALAMPAAALAQTVAGSVVDSTTKLPLPGVSVIVRSARDSSIIRGALSDSAGLFSIRLAHADTVFVDVRRIGLQPLRTPVREIADGATRNIRFEMTRLPVVLDTVRTEGKRSFKSFFYDLTTGQEWFARHYRDGKGFFTSGAEIQLSGLDACDYLSKVPGLQVVKAAPPGVPSISCRRPFGFATGFVVPRNVGTCMEAYVDRKQRLVAIDSSSMLVSYNGTLRWIPVSGIRGIEVFMRYEDRPKDFSFEPRGVGRQMRCSLILVWSSQYWG